MRLLPTRLGAVEGGRQAAQLLLEQGEPAHRVALGRFRARSQAGPPRGPYEPVDRLGDVLPYGPGQRVHALRVLGDDLGDPAGIEERCQ